MSPNKQNNNIFITCNNPAELKSRQNRRTISSFASKSYRPTSKQIVLDRTHFRPFVRRPDGRAPPPQEVRPTKKPFSGGKKAGALFGLEEDLTPRGSRPLDECALGSPLADPFASYPISYKSYIPFLVDYFIRFLTPRFSPALAVETSRYLIWFNVAMHNSEMFHALIALSQVYYNIDVKGFGHRHWTALYHRGEALKQLRLKVETARNSDDDAAILTALWLMDVDAAHDDLHAYAMHKRAKERMVLTRGGIRKLSPELQDELLKSEFFLPLLLHGKFVCELTGDDDMLVRFKENTPVKPTQVGGGFQGLFSIIAGKGLITTQAVEILQRIFKQVAREPHFVRTRNSARGVVERDGLEPRVPPSPPVVDQAFNEMSRVLRITDEVDLQSLHHRLLLALLIYIFNFHNQPQLLLPRTTSRSSPASGSHRTKLRHPYLEILSKVALELSCPRHQLDPTSVTEREVTLWTMVAIGAASSLSPWRLEIPFMGHLVEWMEDDEEKEGEEDEEEAQEKEAPATNTGTWTSAAEDLGSGKRTGTRPARKKRGNNLEKLTACLRGYYLYGADKATLRSLRRWKDPEPGPGPRPDAPV